MVWEQQSRVIIMLMAVNEASQVRPITRPSVSMLQRLYCVNKRIRIYSIKHDTNAINYSVVFQVFQIKNQKENVTQHPSTRIQV